MSDSLRNASLKELQAEMNRRKRGANALVRARAAAIERIAEIDDELASIGIKTPRLSRPASEVAQENGDIADILLDLMDPGTKYSSRALGQMVHANGYKGQSLSILAKKVRKTLPEYTDFRRHGTGPATMWSLK